MAFRMMLLIPGPVQTRPETRAAMAVLRPGGRLYFSNNRRGFKLDPALGREFLCEDITRSTLDPDFERNPKIHCCWSIVHPDRA